MKLTDEQQEAVELFKKSKSLKISAFAGTGKTSTLSELAKSTPHSGLYLAFNKSIANEARAKFPHTVDCRTTHSLAFRSVFGKFRGNTGKLTQALHGNHVAQLLDINEIAVGGVCLKPRSLGVLTAKTIQRFCQSGDEELTVDHVALSGKISKIPAEHQDQFKKYIGELSAHLWDRMSDPRDEAPLGHDGYLKLWSLSKPQLNYDFLLLDEAQDTNEAVLSVLRMQDSHLTLVGDRHQQIYEWRGAINAMASVDTAAEAVLTRSFRFGSDLAHAATSILSILGEKRSLVGDPNKDTRIAAAGKTRTTLCRTNAGVVAVVVDALAEGRVPHVVGGVSELIRMLEDVGRLRRSIPADSAELFGFSDWDDVVEFARSEEGESLRSFVALVAAHGEASLILRLKSVEREEAASDLIVSTGHKAKGREWDSVTLFSDFDPRLSKDAVPRPVINGEEARLLYVATTRAKQLLVVPPRLAEKWNVPRIPKFTVFQFEPSPDNPRHPTAKKAHPQLPDFVEVVRPETRQEKSSTRESQPPQKTAPAESRLKNKAQPIKQSQRKPVSLLSAIVSFFKKN